ncbi:MAG: 30S ribosomal protein S7 [Candidatus Babeliales bacterium]
MPRKKKKVLKRVISPDLLYDSVIIHKFINVLMERGKKNRARKIVYGAMDILAKKVGKEEVADFFMKAFEKVVPVVGVRSRRVGGSTYQVPVRFMRERGCALAMRWIKQAAQQRSGKTMEERLAYEFMDISADKGGALKKRSDVHRMAEANRAYSHFGW